MSRLAGVLIAGSLLVVVGCGSDEDAVDADVAATLGEFDGLVVTVAPDDFGGEVIVIGESSPTLTSIAPELAESGVEPETVDPELNPLGGDDPEDELMPDVVCMDLQDAQDEIQDHGVFLSRSDDATGQGRRQLWDRNWVVVTQSPAPGEPVGEGEAVLTVVKNDEPSPC